MKMIRELAPLTRDRDGEREALTTSWLARTERVIYPPKDLYESLRLDRASELSCERWASDDTVQ